MYISTFADRDIRQNPLWKRGMPLATADDTVGLNNATLLRPLGLIRTVVQGRRNFRKAPATNTCNRSRVSASRLPASHEHQP